MPPVSLTGPINSITVDLAPTGTADLGAAVLSSIPPVQTGIFAAFAEIAAQAVMVAQAVAVGAVASSADISATASVSGAAVRIATASASITAGASVDAVQASAQRVERSASIAATAAVSGVGRDAAQAAEPRSAEITATATVSGEAVAVEARGASIAATTAVSGVSDAATVEARSASIAAVAAVSGAAVTVVSASASIAASAAVSGVGEAASSLDPDAETYITAVEAADGAALEDAVRTAINDFVVGCKSDGIWTAIGSACILAGARTLNGALVPLVGSAPTNVNFVTADYNRKTGLLGDGSTKYIDTNYLDSAVAQDNLHLAVWISQAVTAGAALHMGTEFSGSGLSEVGDNAVGKGFVRSRAAVGGYVTASGGGRKTGLYGSSRDNSANFDWRIGTASGTHTNTSVAATGTDFNVFRRNGNTSSYSDARISFYSAGEALSLTNLSARVGTLMTNLDAAIP